ncbi:TonB-dependent receptor domain-containing protein [Motiliproteus sp. SC1-56]|uniref:TonB-dependent receptor domain-containing protein n=1 Tax=Motiliproteus sp. SC1-56 TaxID=2799565 RepID=UPI001A8DF308|nr:TonB-dependent receptor [Motiliproteus sp. SC1-56]
MSPIRYGLPLAAFFALPLPLKAAEELSSTKVQPVVVTATRLAQTIDQALAPVTVIDRQQIEQSPARDLPALLHLQPGIDLSRSGGLGSNASVFVRGANANQVLVLVDGVRVGSATLGQAAFNDIPLDQIERVEIVRGPRSSLYGSDAIGGVIQIFTRRGQTGFQQHAGIAYGTHDTQRLRAGLSGGDSFQRFSLDLGHLETDGIDAQVGSNPDKDGYRNTNVSASYQHSLTQDLELDLSLLRTDSEVEVDSFIATDAVTNEGQQQVLNGVLRYAANAELDIKLSASESRDEMRELTNGTGTGRFDTRTRQYELTADHYLDDSQIITLGAAHTDQQIDSSSDYAEDERDINAVFGQWQNRWDRLELLLGLRSDDHDSFGRENTGNINAAYHLGDHRKLLASYGTAFHAPTFNDLYFPSSAFGAGNPALAPEESDSWELGYEYNAQGQRYAARAFRTRIDNLIIWQDQGGFFFMPENVGQAKIDGLELEWDKRFQNWSVRASATLLDARDGATDKVLPNRAERTLSVGVGHQRDRLSAELNLLAQGHRYSDAANSNRLAGYGITNLRLGYDLGQQWRLSAQVNNLFDKDYTTNSGFNNLGRTLLVGIDYGI